jgi:hypothetical protein
LIHEVASLHHLFLFFHRIAGLLTLVMVENEHVYDGENYWPPCELSQHLINLHDLLGNLNILVFQKDLASKKLTEIFFM